MPRLRQTEHSEEYKTLAADGSILDDTNYCPVIVTAILCGTDFRTADAALRRQGRKFRRGASTSMVRKAMEELGYKMTFVSTRDFIDQHYPPRYANAFRTVTTHHPRRMGAAWKDGHNYLLVTAGHFAAVVNGQVHDWAINRSLRVNFIYRVEKI